LGIEFIAEIALAIERIAAEPYSYPELHKDVRRALVRRFPYKLWFRLTDSRVTVIACTHAARAPRYVTQRLV